MQLNLNDISGPYWIILFNVIFSLIVLLGTGIYRFVYPKKRISRLILLLIIAVIPTFSLFRPGTYQAGDLRPHTAQFMDFYYNLQQGNIIPQWAGNLCGEYGCPIYEIEYVLPYYLASFFHLLGFSFLTSLKLELAATFIVSGITMYLWAKEELGSAAGFVAAIFYLFAPFNLINLEFRGSVGEVTSFVFIPLLFLFMKRLVERGELKYFFLEAISVWFILLSHSSTTYFSLPLTILYCFILWRRKKKRNSKDILIPLASIPYGILLSAYYWLPALLEVKYTWWSSVFIHPGLGNFFPIWEYFISPFAYGFLFQGHQGDIRLIIGYPHILLILFSIYILIKNKIEPKLKPLLIVLLLYFSLLFFMLLSQSYFIWTHVPLLYTFLGPFRLFVPISFISAAIAGIVVKHFTKPSVVVIICIITILSTILNWENRYMVPATGDPFKVGDAVYTEYFEPRNPLFIKQYQHDQSLGQKIIANPPTEPMKILSGKGTFLELSRLQTSHEYIINAETPVTLRENTFYFPGWMAFANNKKIPINYKDQESNSVGIITFSLKKGLYLVKVIYMDSFVRSVSKMISLCTIVLGIGVIVTRKLKNI